VGQYGLVSEYDELAALYDATRGGERRGDEYAADIDALLPAGEGPVLEIGVGTGVVALGLSRRGRSVVGIDISAPMLARAWSRLGPVVARSDAMRMAVATSSVAHAVSVWLVHSVKDPVLLFEEAARVLRPGGRYVVCTTQRPASDDRVGQVIAAMSARVDSRRGASLPHAVTAEQVLAWAGQAGLSGATRQLARQWRSSPENELAAIAGRQWPALRELDEEAIEEVTRPAVEALKSMPATECLRRATTDVIVLQPA
jgi:ubiquinone/menaquinone biosynthesis C-methylase UbiE